MASDVLDMAQRRLADHGIDVAFGPCTPHHPGLHRAHAQMTRGDSEQQYQLIHGPGVSAKTVVTGRDPQRPTLVITEYVTPRTAQSFREAGVQFLDAQGNAWIRFGDVLLDVRGKARPAGGGTARRPQGSLFSRGRAQVVMALLAWPELWTSPQREVARAAGVSLGQAHHTLALLTETGLGPSEAPAGQAGLLDLWAAAFPTSLAAKLTLATYRSDVLDLVRADGSSIVYLSGESAVTDVLRPSTMTLYVEDLNPHLALLNRWRTDGQPNIVVRRAFWQTPTPHDRASDQTVQAPWPLVYADLLASPDPRVRGVAEDWRHRRA